MFCMNCGAKLQEGAKFCVNCGMAIGENKSNETKLVPAKCTNCNAPLEVDATQSAGRIPAKSFRIITLMSMHIRCCVDIADILWRRKRGRGKVWN